jgi:hypothetical protein
MSKVKGYNPIKQHKSVRPKIKDPRVSSYAENNNAVNEGFTTKPVVPFTTNPNDLKPVSEMPWAHSQKLRTKNPDFDEFSVEILKFAR